MAKNKKEKIVEEAPKVNEPKGDVTKVQEKMKMQSVVQEETITKVNLSEPPTEAPVVDSPVEDVVEEVIEQPVEIVEENIDAPMVEDVTDQVDELTEQIVDAIAETEATGKELPENIQKLMEFMEDTGGDLNDYVKLNQDYSNLESKDLLREFYSQTKPHLNSEEVDFLMEDQFSYDEESDGEIDIRRKKIAMKEQVAQARQHLDGAKSKYYEEIKAGSKLTNEQQKAIDFFGRYNKESQEVEKATKQSQSVFTQKTNEVFDNNFKGFEYNVGDKRFRFNVNDVGGVKQTQSDLSNFTKKFLDDNSTLKDAKGYHKSMFTAMNADAVANHFYEQGKVDALKDSVARSKNINMDARQEHGTVEAGGIKVRVLGDNSSDFKFKIKNKFK